MQTGSLISYIHNGHKPTTEEERRGSTNLHAYDQIQWLLKYPKTYCPMPSINFIIVKKSGPQAGIEPTAFGELANWINTEPWPNS